MVRTIFLLIALFSVPTFGAITNADKSELGVVREYIANGGAERGAAGFTKYGDQKTATISFASPATCTTSAHGLTVGDAIIFSTTGTLPTGLGPGIVYYVSDTASSGLFQVAISRGGASINTSAPGSGTHTWRPYKPTAGSSTTSALATHLTLSSSATTPIAGSRSLTIANAGSTSALGEGVSYAFTIDAKDKAKVLNLNFDYIVSSGTFVAGTSAVESDLEVYIFDVTNQRLIQPSNYKLTSNSSTLVSRMSATFQTASDSTSYRLIFHVSTVNTSAWTIKGEVSIRPSNLVYGSPVTEWTTFTPTGAWSANTTYTGLWRRVGDSMQVQAVVSTSGAPTSASLTVNIPSGYTIDTTKLASTAQNDTLGIAEARDDSGSAVYPGNVRYSSTTAVAILSGVAADPRITAVTQASPFTFANLDAVKLEFTVPIVGWNSTTQMSDTNDGRVVAAKLNGTSGATYTSAATTIVPYGTVVHDTHGAMTTGASAKFTAPMPGYYQVSAGISTSGGTTTAGNSYQIAIYVDGAQVQVPGVYIGRGAAESTPIHGTGAVYLTAGQTVDVRYSGTFASGTIVFSSSATGTPFFEVNRISGPSAISATETVTARAYLSADQTAVAPNGSNIKVNLASTSYDSHGGYDTTNKKYIAQIAGVYSVKARIATLTTNMLANDYQAVLYKNGAAYCFGQRVTFGAVSKAAGLTLVDDVSLAVGDYLELYIFGAGDNSASQITVDGDSGADRTYLSVNRVGN